MKFFPLFSAAVFTADALQLDSSATYTQQYQQYQQAVIEAKTIEADTKVRYETLTQRAIVAAQDAMAVMKAAEEPPSTGGNKTATNAKPAISKEDAERKVEVAQELKKESEDMAAAVSTSEKAVKNAEENLSNAVENNNAGNNKGNKSGKKVAYLQEGEGNNPNSPSSTFSKTAVPTKVISHSSVMADKMTSMFEKVEGGAKNTLFGGVKAEDGNWASWIEKVGAYFGLTQSSQITNAKSADKVHIAPKQDALATQRAVELEANRIIDISDSFLAQETEDVENLRQVKARQHFYEKHMGDQYPDDAKALPSDGPAVQVHHAFAALEHVDDQLDKELSQPDDGSYRHVREVQDASMEALQHQIAVQDSHGKKTKLA